MNLPHIQNQQQNKPKLPARLGKQSLRALSQPIVVRGGRKTVLDEYDAAFGADNILPLPEPTTSWRTLEVQRKNLLNLPYSRLSNIALDLSPQLNKGLWDFIRFGNPGIVVQDANNNQRAVDYSNEFLARIGRYYGNFKNHHDSMWADIFVFGGVFTELTLDEGSRQAVDIAINNPLSARFRLTQDPVRGQIREFGQQTRNGFVSHEGDPTVRYIGFNRIGNNPYGRPLIAPAVHSSLFLLGLVSDLRRVIANQGLSRIDYSLKAEELLRIIDRNPDIAGDDEATAQFITEQINNIKDVLSNLDLEDDYVHLDTVEVNYATSPTQTNMTGLDTLVNNLRIDVVNGMKSISALSNILDSTTETHITRQMEYLIGAIASVQEEVGGMLSDYLNIANQVRGIRSNIMLRHKRQRAQDRRQAADTEKIQTETIIAKREAGIITTQQAQDEVAALTDELVVGL